MDLDEIHRQRLLALIEEAGGMANLARELGHKTTSTLSQYKGRSADSTTGKPKSIGKALCRDLERVRNKPHGWMDLPLGESGQKTTKEASETPEAPSGTRADYALRSVRAVLEAMGFSADQLGTSDDLRAALAAKEPLERYSLTEIEETLRGLHQDKPAAFRNAHPDELFSVLANRLRGEGKADPQNATESPATNVAHIPTK